MQVTKSVKNPRKQRQRLFNAPAHIRHKVMSAHLAPDLAKTHGARSLPVRKGDTVRIMRGDHEGFEGKISTVDLTNYRIYLEGLTREKVDGTVIFVAVHPSKVLIKNLNLDDKWRKRALQRKKPLEMREESGLVVKPEEEEEAKPAKAKPKRAAKPKAQKPVKKEIKPEEAKPEAPEEVKVAEKVEAAKEKPAAKKPRAAKKAPAKAGAKAVKEKPAAVTKPTRKKRESKAAKEAVPAEEKLAEAEKQVEKPVKKAPTKKAPAKRKPKVAEETGGA